MSMIKKCIALLPLFAVVIALALAIWDPMRTSFQGYQDPTTISSPYVYEHQYDRLNRSDQWVSLLVDHIREIQTGKSVSLYPYTHANAYCQLPLTGEGLGYFRIRSVQYEFQVIDDAFCVLSTQFYAEGHWRILSEESGTVYEERLDGHWPFRGRNKILELPKNAGFYDPIAISGLDGCGVLLLSSDDPGRESNIRVYIPTKKGWCQAKFQMPDGTQRDSLQGYVHRQNDNLVRDSANEAIGKMEVCIRDQRDHYATYTVTYSDEMLMLESVSTADVTDEDLFNWMY